MDTLALKGAEVNTPGTSGGSAAIAIGASKITEGSKTGLLVVTEVSGNRECFKLVSVIGS